MDKRELNEAEIRSKFITPAITAAVWDLMKQIREVISFTNGRITENIGMIATRAGSKSLECLLFLRDVRSQLNFEQMKGRGTRTIETSGTKTCTHLN